MGIVDVVALPVNAQSRGRAAPVVVRQDGGNLLLDRFQRRLGPERGEVEPGAEAEGFVALDRRRQLVDRAGVGVV
jgi:hypothetical protein